MPVIHLLKQHFTLLNALILLGLCASATAQITTITANNLACRANGAQRNPSAWRLDYNGFLGTFISVTGTSPATVGFAVSASKSSNDSGTPQLRLRLADSNQTWNVTAIGNSYANYSQTWTLPPGTYAVRLEYINHAQSLQLNIASLTVSNATVANTASNTNALASADTYIANYRQGQVTVTVLNANGQPLTNTAVRFKLQRHAFNFGTAVYGTSTADGPWISGTGSNEISYRNFLNQNFNSIEPENAGKWPWNEAVSNVVTMEFIDQIRSYAAANNKRVRMHGVLWGAAHPEWVNALINTATNAASTPAEMTAATNALRQAISRRIQYFLVQTNRALGYAELDGINESVHQPIYTTIYGLSGVAGINNEIQQGLNSVGAPTKNCVNEYNVLQQSDTYANWYLQHIESLRTDGATNSITGIGIQYYVAPSSHLAWRIRAALDNLSAEGTPLSLTEYGVYSSDTTQRVATVLAETVRVVFGHDQMNTFNLWGFWYPAMWANYGPLMDANWNLTLSGQTWQQMMGVTNWGLAGVPMWTTDVTLATDAQGKAAFTGYYGDYTASAGAWEQDFTVAKAAANNLVLTNTPVVANFLVVESTSGKAELYRSSGAHLGTFANGFITPIGVAEGGGYVFISDLAGSYVYKYSTGGPPLGIVNQGAVTGNHMPGGIAYANGRINGTAYNISYVTSSAPDAGVEDGSPSTPSSYLYYATPAGPHGITSAAPNGFPGLYYTTSAGDGSGTLGYWEPGVSAIDGIISFAAGSNPRGVVADSSGDLFIALSGAGKIVKRDGAGVLTDWLTGLNSPVGLAVDGGNLYVSSYSGKTITGYRLTDVSQVSQFSTLSNPQYFAITRIAARPVANDASFVRPAGLTLKIRVTDLLANASDANGYPLTLLSVGPSTNGVAVTTDESFMSYANPSAVADRFPYTVSNGQGGSATANVFINITTNSIGRVQGITVTNGAVALKFAGIQNYRYDVERATDVTFKQNRTVLLTTNAPASGLFSITDTDPPAPMAYYRLRYNP